MFKKKLLAALLVLAVTLLSAPLCGFPVAFAGTSGYLTYSISNNAVQITACSWDASGALTIPQTLEGYPVTSIADNVFGSHSNLTSIIIPSGMTSIGKSAFSGCTKLTAMTIPNSVTSIGDSAFSGCSILASVTLPSGLTSIPKTMFQNCSALASILIPNSVTSIGERAFENCVLLTSAEIPNGVTAIQTGTFYGCSKLASVKIPNSVTIINTYAFYGCIKLTSITIPKNVTNIYGYAFQGCTLLTNALIPAKASIDAASAFSGTALTSLTLQNITWDALGQPVEDVNSYTTADRINLGLLPTGALTTLKIFSPAMQLVGTVTHTPASSVTVYGHLGSTSQTFASTNGYTFSVMTYTLRNAELTYQTINSGTAVRITDCVMTVSGPVAVPAVINGLPVTNIGSEAFKGCAAFTSMTIPNSVTTIDGGAFSGCTALSSISLPDSVTYIGSGAFTNTAYYNNAANWESNVLYIGKFLIAGKTALSGSYSIKAGTLCMGNAAFSGCTALTGITVPVSLTRVSYEAFSGCSTLASVTLPTGVTSIDDRAFYNCIGLTSITIPSSLTSIGTAAFKNCGLLTVFSLPSGLKSIGANAFESTGLTSVTIPSSVTSIGTASFKNCNSLTGATLPEGLTSIGANTFEGCGALANVNIPDTVITIGASAFYNCASVTTIGLPNSVTSIGATAFYGCIALTNVTILNSVVSIGNEAFKNCISLADILIPADTAKLGTNVFYNTAITTLTLRNMTRNTGGWLVEDTGSYSSSNQIDFSKLETDDAVNVYIYDPYASITGTIVHTPASSVTIHGYYMNARPYANTNGCAFDPMIFILSPAELSYTSINGGTAIEITDCLESVSGPVAIPAQIGGLPIVKIGASAFMNCSLLTNVMIPSGVMNIGASTFEGCTALANVYVPDSVISIGAFAFTGCPSLTAVNVDGNNGSYSSTDGVLFNKNKTTLIMYPSGKSGAYVVPADVTSIGESAFYSCADLTSVTILNSVASIGNEAFKGCVSLANVLIPADTAKLGTDVFYNTAITTLTLQNMTRNTGGELVEDTGSYSSSNQIDFSKLKTDDTVNVYIYNPYASITGTIAHTPVSSVTVHGYYMNARTFANTNGYTFDLMTFILTPTELSYSSIDSGTAVEIADCLESIPGPVAIPAQIGGLPVKSVGTNAFSYCSLLTNITIPNGVTSIGAYTFRGCSSVTNVTIPSSVTSIGNYAFHGCALLASINIPSGVTSLGNSLFYQCFNLTSVQLPDGVTSIGDRVFYGCGCLKNLTFPSGVTSIGTEAFAGCALLTDFNIPAGLTSIGAAAFSNCAALTAINVDGNNAIYSSTDGVLFNKNKTVLIQCPGKKSGAYTVPASVTSIGDTAFFYCRVLTKVDIPDSVTSIGNKVFYGCQLLSRLYIPDTVTNIGTQAIYYPPYGFVLYCWDNSAAKTYAVNNSISYQLVVPFAQQPGSALVLGTAMLTNPETRSMTVTNLLSEFTNTNITIWKNGAQLSGGVYVGTGCEIRLMASTLTAKTLTAVFTGDISGDGVCDSLDAFLCDKAVNSHSTLTGAYYAAANMDTADPDIDIADFSLLLNSAVGKSA